MEHAETAWKAILNQASAAAETRQWALLRHLFYQALAAPDAPDVHGHSRAAHPWNRLMLALVRHEFDIPDVAWAAVRLLVTRARERCGAAGAPTRPPRSCTSGSWARWRRWTRARWRT